MDRLGAMRLFTRVAETGSFSAAAREAGVGQPAVSKQVAALEDHLGAPLLHRTPRGLTLTEAGLAYYEAAARVLGEIEAAEAMVGRGLSQPTGILRVSVSGGFGRMRVVPLLPEFRARYPGIIVDLIVSDRFVDLVEEGIDLAIRIGDLADSGLIARRVGISRRVTVGGADYLARAGAPTTPDDLAGHPCVAFTFQRVPRPWRFHGPSGVITYRPDGPIRVNDGENVRAAVLAGLGIAQAPRWLFADELESGAVRAILRDFPGDATPIHLVFPPGRKPTGKTRVFADFVAESFAADPEFSHSELE